MSTLTKKFFAAASATASMEQLIGSVDSSGDVFDEPEVQAGAGEIESKEFVGNVDEVERVTQLVTAAAAAQTAEEVVEETSEVRGMAEELTEGVTTLNEAAGGATLESFHYIQIAADRLAARVGRASIPLGVGLESFTDGKRVLINTAGLEAFIGDLNASSATLLRASQDRLVEMVQAIREALPDARDRLTTLLSDLELTTGDLSGRVTLSPAVQSALSVDGTLPEDLVTYFSTYASYGKALTCDYSRRAVTATEQASGLLGTLNYTNPEAFWDTLGQTIEKIGDPRAALSADTMSLALPGTGVLFEEGDGKVPDGNPTFQKLAAFILARKPLVSTDNASEEQLDEPPVEMEPDATVDDDAMDTQATSGSVDSLTREQLRVIAKALLDTACPDAIERTLKGVEKNWNTSQAALAETRETIRNVSGDVSQSLGIQLDMIPRYVETLHRLSVWPQINFVTNLIFTINAFVLMGSEMVNGDRLEEAPIVDPAADPLADPSGATDPTNDINVDDASGLGEDDALGGSVDGTTTDPTSEPNADANTGTPPTLSDNPTAVDNPAPIADTTNPPLDAANAGADGGEAGTGDNTGTDGTGADAAADAGTAGDGAGEGGDGAAADAAGDATAAADTQEVGSLDAGLPDDVNPDPDAPLEGADDEGAEEEEEELDPDRKNRKDRNIPPITPDS